VPQSLLFAGPEGVGKGTVALALAQALNCPVRREKGADDACGTCAACRRIAAGTHSDVLVLDTGGEASIKIRALRERVLDVIGYRPFEAARRVFIIDPADALGPEAQDALLKTLEEPPPSANLILVSAYPDTLHATIRSRCRRLRFGPLTDEDVFRVLTERAGIDAARARALAAVAGGSPGRALAGEAGELDDDRDAALAVLAAARGRAVAPRLRAAAALAQHGSKRRDREALDTRLAALASLLRDVGVIASRGQAPLANADLADTLADLARAFDLPRVSTAFDAIVRAQDALERNAGPKIVADWVAVTI
jgi:DNA polymerase-3 subunit delta'